MIAPFFGFGLGLRDAIGESTACTVVVVSESRQFGARARLILIETRQRLGQSFGVAR